MTQQTYEQAIAVGVDMQNDFCPGGTLAVAEGDLAVRDFNRIACWTRLHQGHVVFTRDWHPENTGHFAEEPDFATTWPVHCVAGTEGAKFNPFLEVHAADLILSKGMGIDEDAYSGFQGIGENGETLDGVIRHTRGKSLAVIVGGLATDYCVKATVMDALKLAGDLPTKKVGVFAVTSAMRAVAEETGREAIEEMVQAGATLITSDQLHHGEAIRLER